MHITSSAQQSDMAPTFAAHFSNPLPRGLRRHARVEMARTIEDRSAALVERSGFHEYYDPATGEGFGARDFSWTGLALNLLLTLEEDGL